MKPSRWNAFVPSLPVPADVHALGRHLVRDHGLPAGLLETVDPSYSLGDLQWEHRGLHNAHRTDGVASPAGPGSRRRHPGLPPLPGWHSHADELPEGTRYRPW